MKFLDLHKLSDKKLLKAGRILIAEPFLKDSSFARSVVLLCEHGSEGALGFILNKPTEMTIGDLLPELYAPTTIINKGGPVQLDTLHMLHGLPKELGGSEVANGVYWGGSYEVLQSLITDTTLKNNLVKLLVGYAGWSPGQLEDELKEGSWLISDINDDIIFETDPNEMWRKAILSLGKEYAYLANMPTDPQLN
ncbi:MAG: YqgE/AlgH family protein [Flavipsychrobacter sp.]